MTPLFASEFQPPCTTTKHESHDEFVRAADPRCGYYRLRETIKNPNIHGGRTKDWRDCKVFTAGMAFTIAQHWNFLTPGPGASPSGYALSYGRNDRAIIQSDILIIRPDWTVSDSGYMPFNRLTRLLLDTLEKASDSSPAEDDLKNGTDEDARLVAEARRELDAANTGIAKLETWQERIDDLVEELGQAILKRKQSR